MTHNTLARLILLERKPMHVNRGDFGTQTNNKVNILTKLII